MYYSRFLPDQIRSFRFSVAVSAATTAGIGLSMGKEFYDGTLLNLMFMIIYYFVIIGGVIYLLLWGALHQLDPDTAKTSTFTRRVVRGLFLLGLRYLGFFIKAMSCIGAFYFLLWMTGRL